MTVFQIKFCPCCQVKSGLSYVFSPLLTRNQPFRNGFMRQISFKRSKIKKIRHRHQSLLTFFKHLARKGGTVACHHQHKPLPMPKMGTDQQTNESVDLKHFCCQEILIPPTLPSILKQYAKAAIRTQPRDLLFWSAAYFRALANGEVPPDKERLEYPSGSAPSGLTPGLLKILHRQLNPKGRLTTSQLKIHWTSLCLPAHEVDRILQTGNVDTNGFIDWATFLTLAGRTMGRDLNHAMQLICEVLTDQPDGCPPYISFPVFTGIYKYLATLENPPVPFEQVEDVLTHLKTAADGNYNLVGPPDFDLEKCPPLQ